QTGTCDLKVITQEQCAAKLKERQDDEQTRIEREKALANLSGTGKFGRAMSMTTLPIGATVLGAAVGGMTGFLIGGVFGLALLLMGALSTPGQYHEAVGATLALPVALPWSLVSGVLSGLSGGMIDAPGLGSKDSKRGSRFLYSLHKAGQTAGHAVTLAGGAALGLSGLGVAIPLAAPIAAAVGTPLALGAGAYSLTSAGVSVGRSINRSNDDKQRIQHQRQQALERQQVKATQDLEKTQVIHALESLKDTPSNERWHPERAVKIAITKTDRDRKPVLANARLLPQSILPIIPEEALLVQMGGKIDTKAADGWQHRGKVVVRVTHQPGEARDKNSEAVSVDKRNQATRVHDHADLGVPIGTPVRNPKGGKLIYEKQYADNEDVPTGYGKFRVVQYEDSEHYYFVLYAHMSKLNRRYSIDKASFIPSGAILGLSGDTGAPGNPHLDYGLYKVRKDKT
ncbi:MAG: M23 family metallopeptidase, partial [Elusimicrobiota bacterium]